jgi:prolyl oligopeptidase
MSEQTATRVRVARGAESGWSCPDTERDDVVDTLHGFAVPDPYRWLEDPDSDRTRRWVAAQNQATDAYLATLGSGRWFTDALESILGRPRTGVPVKKGGRYLVTGNDGTQDQDSVHVAGDLATLLAGGRVLIDPVEFSAGGTVSISGVVLSPDGARAAYGLSESGSDWISWRVRDVDSGADTADLVTRAKFSLAEWLPDGTGFLYWAYPEHQRASGEDATPLGAGTLLLHRLGTAQADDEVIHHDPAAPRERVAAVVTEDGRWLVMTITVGTARRNRVAVRRIGADGRFGPVVDVVAEPTALWEPAGSDGDALYLRTDQDAPRCRLVAVDLAALADPAATADPGAWAAPRLREVVGEREAVLTHVLRAGAGFVAAYVDDASHRVRRFTLDGTDLGEVDLGGGISLVGVTGRPDDAEAFVGVTSFVRDTRVLRVDLATGQARLLVEAGPAGPAGAAVTGRHRATSRDGASVPYFLVRRADLPAGRPLPTLLYGYGGFNQSMTPSFKAAWPAWVEAGGVLVVANLRGGGEYGRDWHESGTRERKQNVFDDFVAVAEHLVATGVTTPAQLVLHGRSNGGLLVGAVLTQRPDLAAGALPMVGVLDMLRFHKFTIGRAWIPDYGDPDHPEDFRFLHAYSPLHNVVEGTSYPATLVLTGDHDDRVVPAHSHKFTAALQRAHAGPAPVLARIETATGHGVGKPRRMLAAEFADMLAFAAEHTGLVPGGGPA